MTISFEIALEHRDKWPPFSDGCPKCVFGGVVVPIATVTNGDSLVAFYHHGRCDHQWYTTWSAQYDHTWKRVVGDEPGGARHLTSVSLPRRALPAHPLQPTEPA